MTEKLTTRERARQLMSGGKKTAPNRNRSSVTAPAVKTIGRSFDDHPGFVELQRLDKGLGKLGINNPYFRPWSIRDKARLLIDGQWNVNFSSYNYLGLASEPELALAAKSAIDDYGMSVSAARIVSGEIPLYQEFERELADFFGTEDAMIFVSGFLTNVSTLGYLFGEKDLIIHDSLIHNSMVTGAMLSGAKRLTFNHNDPAALDKILSIHRNRYERAVILTEGVFSMDGDVGAIRSIVNIAEKYDASIMLDEAHSLGTIGATGRGVQEEMQIKPDEIDIWMGSLSKSLGSVGGYIAGKKSLIENIRYYAPGAALYCATTPPPSAAAGLAGLRKLKAEPWRVQNLQRNAKHFLAKAKAHGLNTGISEGTAVVPIYVGDTIKSIRVMDALNRDGVNVQAIFHPVVPQNEARLRFFINADHTIEDLDMTIEKIVRELDSH